MVFPSTVDDPYCRTAERVTATVGHVTMGLLCFCLTGRPAQAESLPAESMPTDEQSGTVQVYLSEPQARTRIFPDATHFERRVHMIDSTARAEISERLGRRVVDDSFAVYIARGAQEELLGYAALTEEVGKYRPITFMVGVGADLSIQEVAVLVYRESRGGEVRRTRFLRQYRGKDGEDPIRIDRDIINITGATLSVRALNYGVRKTLALTELIYRDPLTSRR